MLLDQRHHGDRGEALGDRTGAERRVGGGGNPARDVGEAVALGEGHLPVLDEGERGAGNRALGEQLRELAVQVLDGVSATVLGLAVPLIAADLTVRTGYLNLAIGSFGLAAGLGATFSTTVAGWVADRMGADMAFLGLALVGALATALLALAMPETQPATEARGAEAPA